MGVAITDIDHLFNPEDIFDGLETVPANSFTKTTLDWWYATIADNIIILICLLAGAKNNRARQDIYLGKFGWQE